jgi:sulfur carrier protein ThiS
MSDGNGDALTPYVAQPEIVDHEVAGSVRVLALRNPFTMTREERFVPEGRTLADILADLDLPDWQSAMVALDGRPVEAKWWAVTRPKADHLVTVRVIPRGGGGSSGNKGWIQIAAGVVLIVVGVIFTLWGGGIGVPLIVMGVGLVIGGALTLLLPPPSLPRLKSGSGAEPRSFR